MVEVEREPLMFHDFLFLPIYTWYDRQKYGSNNEVTIGFWIIKYCVL